MKRAHRVFIAGAAACVLVACNLIAGFESEYSVGSSSGGEGGPPDGTTAEGSTDGPATTDGSNDGGLDAKVDGAYCSTVAAGFVLCRDFEDNPSGPKFGLGGAVALPDAASQIQLLGEGGVGGTKGLEVTFDRAAGGQYVYVHSTLLGGSPSVNNLFEAEFDFRIAQRGPDDLALGMITFPGEATADREHGIAYYPGELVWKMGGTGGSIADTDPPAWHHAKITLDRDAGAIPLRRTITIDGMPVDQSGSHPIPDAGGAELRLGAFNVGTGTGTTKIVFDNIVLRTKP